MDFVFLLSISGDRLSNMERLCECPYEGDKRTMMGFMLEPFSWYVAWMAKECDSF